MSGRRNEWMESEIKEERKFRGVVDGRTIVIVYALKEGSCSLMGRIGSLSGWCLEWGGGGAG